MKMKKSDVNILLMVIGIALAAVCYFLVYQNLVEKTDALQASNATLEQEVNYLQDLANNKQQYLDDTAAMQTRIEEIKAQFPAQYLPEDEILYVVGVEEAYDTEVSSIGMAASTMLEVAAPVSDVPVTEGEEAAPAEGEGEAATATPQIMLYQTPVNVVMTSSYNSIKDIIKKINEDTDRKSIETISMAFDTETGDLLANLSFNMYTLTGTDAEYTTPKVDGVTFGTNNIFNSADKKAAIKAEKAAEEAGNSEEE